MLEPLLAIGAICLAVISLFSGVRALQDDEILCFAAEVVLTVIFLAYAIIHGVKVWW